jgi:hypothetical protein
LDNRRPTPNKDSGRKNGGKSGRLRSRRIRVEFAAVDAPQGIGMSVAAFEDRVGFAVEPALRERSEVAKWNVDCLRFVCGEIGADWLGALQ